MEGKWGDAFLSAVAALRVHHPQLRPLVVGRFGNRRAAVPRRRARRRGHRSPHGERDDARELMAALDELCLPSSSEGLPIVLLQAAAMGVLAVATVTGAVADVVLDGPTGVLVAVGDAAALTEAVAGMLTDPARRVALGTAARDQVRAAFGTTRIVERYAALYDAVLDGTCIPT